MSLLPGLRLGLSKHVGPIYDLFGHLFSILWPVVTIQYWCGISRDVIWCHDFGPTAPLQRQNFKTLYFDFPRSLIIISKRAKPRYILYGLAYSIPWPLVTIQCRCHTWRDVTWCQYFGSTAPLWHQTLESLYLDFLRSAMVIPKHVESSYTFSELIYQIS